MTELSIKYEIIFFQKKISIYNLWSNPKLDIDMTSINNK